MNDTKICGKCKQELPLNSEFYHRMRSTADGFRGTCKACRKQRDKHVAEHGVEEKVLDGTRQCCMCKEKLPATNEFFHKNKSDKSYGVGNVCKPCTYIYQKQYRIDSQEKVHEWYNDYRSKPEVKQRVKEYNKLYQKKNRAKLTKLSREWREKNREEQTIKRRLYERHKAKTDHTYRLTKNLRRRVYSVLNGKNKSASTLELIGCTVDELKVYLEGMFEDWMNWENYGAYTVNGVRSWVVDHIKPCASFDLSQPEQQRACFNYKNLQPLCGRENLVKGDKLDYPTKKGQQPNE